MAVKSITKRTEEFDDTLPSTAGDAREFRVYAADRVTINASVALELWYTGDDGDTKTPGDGFEITAAMMPWTIPVDRRDLMTTGYFKFLLTSTTTSAAVEGVAETGKAA